MDRSRILTLIGYSYSADNIGQQVPQEQPREVFCNITSVSREEWMDGGKQGLKPEYRATLFAYDYDGETVAELDGVRYAVYRTFLGANETVELYLERQAGIDAKNQAGRVGS